MIINRILIVIVFIWLGCLTWYARVQPNWKYEYFEVRDECDSLRLKLFNADFNSRQMQHLAESFKIQMDTFEIPEEYPEWQKYKIVTTLDSTDSLGGE